MISSIDLYSQCDAKGLHCAGDDFRSILSGVVNISARGRIGTVELDYARHVGLNVIDVSPADAAREYN